MRNLIATIVLVTGSWLTTAAQIPADEVADRMALKELVDTFSNLADVKDVDAQMALFTDNAEVHSKSGDRVSVMKGTDWQGVCRLSRPVRCGLSPERTADGGDKGQ